MLILGLVIFFTLPWPNLFAMSPQEGQKSKEPLIPKQWALAYSTKTSEEVKKEQYEYEKRLAELERRLDEFEKERGLKNREK